MKPPLLASYGHLGRQAEADAWLSDIRATQPNFALSSFPRLPYKFDRDFQRIIDGLRKAGVPEKPVVAASDQ